MGTYGLKVGTPELESVGPITFGPDGILFVADNAAAKVVAVDVGDEGRAPGGEPFDLEDLDVKLAAFLGCGVEDFAIRDMAVHPSSENVYLSVTRGHGDAAAPVLVRIDRTTGGFEALDLRDVPFAEAPITNAPAADDARLDLQVGEGPDAEELQIGDRTLKISRRPARTSTITDLAYVDGTLLAAGMSNEEFSSNLRRIPFPFTGDMADNSLEIFHVSHGAWETASPIRTFVPYEGGASVLASYTCTPVVHFPLGDLTSGTKATGRTVAELGPMNQPIDMVSFNQGDGEYLLISHTNHPLMKIACADIDGQEPLTEPRGAQGVPREERDLKGVGRLANLNDTYVLTMQRDESGRRHLRSLKASSL